MIQTSVFLAWCLILLLIYALQTFDWNGLYLSASPFEIGLQTISRVIIPVANAIMDGFGENERWGLLT